MTLPVYRKGLYYLTQILADAESKTQIKKLIFIWEMSTAIFHLVCSLKCLQSHYLGLACKDLLSQNWVFVLQQE